MDWFVWKNQQESISLGELDDMIYYHLSGIIIQKILLPIIQFYEFVRIFPQSSKVVLNLSSHHYHDGPDEPTVALQKKTQFYTCCATVGYTVYGPYRRISHMFIGNHWEMVCRIFET